MVFIPSILMPLIIPSVSTTQLAMFKGEQVIDYMDEDKGESFYRRLCMVAQSPSLLRMNSYFKHDMRRDTTVTMKNIYSDSIFIILIPFPKILKHQKLLQIFLISVLQIMYIVAC